VEAARPARLDGRGRPSSSARDSAGRGNSCAKSLTSLVRLGYMAQSNLS